MIRAKIQSSLPISIFITKITRFQSAEFSLRRYFESYSTPTVGWCIISTTLAIPSTVCFYKTFSAHIVCTSHLRADKRINQSLRIANLANHVTFTLVQALENTKNLNIFTSGIVIGYLRWVWLFQSVRILGRLNIVALHELGKLKTFYRFHPCLQNSDFFNWIFIKKIFFEFFDVLETFKIELFAMLVEQMEVHKIRIFKLEIQ